MHEGRGTVEVHALKSLATLVKVNHCEEHLTRVELAVPVAIRNKAEFIASLPTYRTATVALQGGEHDHNRVVLRLGPHQVLEVLI